jgi:fucose 4-O-acetylase-like acetyltransferase
MRVLGARDSTMDALKGAAILLVVLGHSIQALPGFDYSHTFRLIYSFHMPLFMFVSGYIAFYSRDNTSWVQLRKKAALLVLPFLAWYAVSYIVNGVFMNYGLKWYAYRLLLSPDWGLWFLWVLFLNFILLAGALRAERYLKFLALPAFWLLLQFSPTNNFGISLLKWHFTFFALGYLAHRHAGILKRYRKPVALISLVCFPLLAWGWHRVGPPDLLGPLSMELSWLHIDWALEPLLAAYTYIVPLLGIFAAWTVMSILPLQAPTFFRLFQWLGAYTLDIYVSHQYLLRFGVGDGVVLVMTAFAVGLVGSLAISFLIVRRNEITAHIFLGKPYPRRAEKSEKVPAQATTSISLLRAD